MNIHAHISSYTTDCDGPMSDTYVMTPNESEIAEHEAAVARGGYNDFSDIHFHDRVITHLVNTYSLFSTGRLDVTKFEDGTVRLEWSEQTDEGGRSVEALICEDDCDTEHRTHRDYFAEAMNY